MLSQESYDFWNDEIKPIFANVLHIVKEACPKETQSFFDPLFEKIDVIGNSEAREVNTEKMLKNSVDKFNNNSARLLAATQ